MNAAILAAAPLHPEGSGSFAVLERPALHPDIQHGHPGHAQLEPSAARCAAEAEHSLEAAVAAGRIQCGLRGSPSLAIEAHAMQAGTGLQIDFLQISAAQPALGGIHSAA